MQMLEQVLRQHSSVFHKVVDFDGTKEKLSALDLTVNNKRIAPEVVGSTFLFSQVIEAIRRETYSKFLIGGYDELRTVYTRSELFNSPGIDMEPRRLHIGTDIWGDAGTIVYAPFEGVVHSIAHNDNHGDYGPTIILAHTLEGIKFHTLYGHLALKDIGLLKPGETIVKGQPFCHLGIENENGHWPPHLHFQVIQNMEGLQGDYPGVCQLSKRDYYLQNCPDPDLILNLNRFIGLDLKNER